MGNAVEKGPDIKVKNPVLFPATSPGHGQGVMGASPRTVTVAVRVEDRFQERYAKLPFPKSLTCEDA
jgi:hypothetical protein